MTASLKQIQTFVDHCRASGAKEVEVSKAGFAVKVVFEEMPEPARILEAAAELQTNQTLEAFTEQDAATRRRKASENLLFGSSS